MTEGRPHSSQTAELTKQRADAPEGFFAVEAAGLSWLRAAGGVWVVEVYAVTGHRITVEHVSATHPTMTAAEEFGRDLATTHAAGAAAFGQPPEGWSGDGFIGDARLTMRPTPTWGRFYAEQRVLPYARGAADAGSLARSDLRAVESVCDRLVSGDFDDDRPSARIHGDLWAGNVIFTDQRVALIDPAAHGGHPLTDLAMLSLFGCPHLEVVLAAYAEAATLSSGWRDLTALHQLHPVLVHAELFGGPYGPQAGRLARTVLTRA